MPKYTLKEQYRIGRKVNNQDTFACKKRAIVYAVRVMLNPGLYQELYDYCANYTPYPEMLIEAIDMTDVLGCVVLYKDSTIKERLNAWKDHFDRMQTLFSDEAIYHLYHKVPYPDPELASPGWVLYENEEMELVVRLAFCKGQRKEGFMSILIEFAGEKLYNVNLRLAKGFCGEHALVIGTIQGKKEGLLDSKKLTKKMFGYRPKNLALYTARLLAQALGAESLYAVSDYGFYANSHAIRIHRSKTVYFDDFWRENGGVECAEDKRFFKIPLEEARKTYETAKTHKRNMYRKRYELLDAYKESLVQEIEARRR